MRNPIVVTKSIDRFSTQDMAKISCKPLAKGLSTDQFSTELFFLKKKLEILKTKITQFHQRGEVSTRDGLTGVLSLYEEVIIDFGPDKERGIKNFICPGSFYVALTRVRE